MATENFSAWTQVDPNARITATATKMSWAGLLKNETAYGYYDFGAGHFKGGFNHLFKLYIDLCVNADICGYYMVCNDLGNYNALLTANKPFIVVYVWYYTPNYALYLSEAYEGALYQDSYVPTLDTPYYCTFTRDEETGTYGTIYLSIYSDAARTTLLDTLSVALHGSKVDYRYLECPTTFNNTGAGGDTGYIENLDLQEIKRKGGGAAAAILGHIYH